MSNDPISKIIKDERTLKRFGELNILKNVSWEQESAFAIQQLTKSDYSMKTAQSNPMSVKGAILNVAAIGISLNPASQHAYLVPRGGEICLDISYKGLVKLATDSGSIKWTKAELVYEKEIEESKFKWRGSFEIPFHEPDIFLDDRERGAIKGCYCVTKLYDDSFMCEAMSLSEINKIKSLSKAKSGPWVDFFGEMAKKTIIKRASKSWPQIANRERWDKAIQVLHQSEGIAYTPEEEEKYKRCIEQNDAIEFHLLTQNMPIEKRSALFSSGEPGKKVALKEADRKLSSEGYDKFSSFIFDLQSCIESKDEYGCKEIIETYKDDEDKLNLILSNLTAEENKFIKESCIINQ